LQTATNAGRGGDRTNHRRGMSAARRLPDFPSDELRIFAGQTTGVFSDGKRMDDGWISSTPSDANSLTHVRRTACRLFEAVNLHGASTVESR